MDHINQINQTVKIFGDSLVNLTAHADNFYSGKFDLLQMDASVLDLTHHFSYEVKTDYEAEWRPTSKSISENVSDLVKVKAYCSSHKRKLISENVSLSYVRSRKMKAYYPSFVKKT